MTDNFQEALIREVSLFFDPLIAAFESEEALQSLFGSIGWDLNAITDFPISELQDCFKELAAAYTQIESYIDTPPLTLGDLLEALSVINEVSKNIQDLYTILNKNGIPEPPGFDKLAEDLIEYLIVDYLFNHYPLIYSAAMLATIITPNGGPATELVVDPNTKRVNRNVIPRPKIHLDRLPQLLQDPVKVLKAEYFLNGLPSYADALRSAQMLFPRLQAVLELLSVRTASGLNPKYEINLGFGGNEIAQLSIGAFIPLEPDPLLEGSGFGAVFSLSPADRGDLGLVISPFGRLSLTQLMDSWEVMMQLEGGTDGFALHLKHGLRLPNGSQDIRVKLSTRWIRLADTTGPAIFIGSVKGTRLEIGHFAISANGMFHKQQIDYGFLTEIGAAAFVVNRGEGDGFLQKVLPEEIRTAFDLAVGWSSDRGLYFRGGGALEVSLPVHLDLFGILKVERVDLGIIPGLEANKSPEIVTVAAISASLKLGPLAANVERIGIKAIMTFPKNGGNLGPLNLLPAFKPPDGAGMVLDAAVVTGGGYIEFKPENEEYSGILQLEIQDMVSIKAIALLTTRVPGLPPGVKGFSLLLILTAEFPPIQLGYGFALLGVGGLIGANRTMLLDPLRDGIKNHTVDSILFPKDPVENAQRIISDLKTIFPPAEGRFVLGPMIKLSWGTPAIITGELGILLELPAPIRLAILGKLKLALPPVEGAEVLILQMDVIGALDFDKGDASVDATLVDSRIATFPLTGDMAMRLNWGASPVFALAAGGFHPQFQPPPGFPNLSRLAISLATGDNPRLRLEAYTALTASTAMLGARLDLFAEENFGDIIGRFTVIGYLGFDALVKFQPFSFVLDIGGAAALKHNDEDFLALTVALTLTGPQPWHAWGEARFEFLGKHRIAFDVTIGEAAGDPPRIDVKPLDELVAALKDPNAWSAQFPDERHMLVTIRKLEPGNEEVLVHPLGKVTLRQRAVPLAIELERFGEANLVGPRKYDFDITLLGANGTVQNLTSETVKDNFSPAQFYEMSDDEKLSRPAFEQLPSGHYWTSDIGIVTGPKQSQVIGYETVIIDKKDNFEKRNLEILYTPHANVVKAAFSLGAAARSPMRSSGSRRFTGPSDEKIQVKDTGYVLVTKDGIQPVNGGKTATYIETELARKKQANPEKLQVVASHEIERGR